MAQSASKAQEYDLDLVTCKFEAAAEQLRPPKIVRVGILQHQLPLPPNTEIKILHKALLKLAAEAIETAALGAVNIFCFQEAWSIFCFFFHF